MGVTFFLLGLLTFPIHEIGHILAAKVCGVKVKKVGISLGGLYNIRESGSREQNFFIAASGPVFNLLLSFLCCAAFPHFALANLITGVVNLVPLPKSDGLRLVKLACTKPILGVSYEAK